jgi:sugar phosphate permease
MGPLFDPRVRRCFLVLGLILHGAIVLVMGITSFSLVMAAALLLHLVPTNASYGDIFPRKRDWFVARQHAD